MLKNIITDDKNAIIIGGKSIDIMLKSITTPKNTRGRALMFAVLAVLGCLLMIIPKCTSANKAKENSDELSDLDPAVYASQVEKKVEELCSKVDGVSSVYAVVTLKSGYRAIYATDYQYGNSNSKNKTVIIGSGSGAKALLIGYENPEIAGIGIVCSGGDDARRRAEIISIVSSAFDVSTNKIFVCGS